MEKQRHKDVNHSLSKNYKDVRGSMEDNTELRWEAQEMLSREEILIKA